MGADIWPGLLAPLLNAMALLLALGFRRNRAVLILLLLAAVSLAFADISTLVHGQRRLEAVRMFAPWLLLVAAVMPERRLLARRNLFLVGLLGIAFWLAFAAPEHVWISLRDALPLGWLPWTPAAVASALVLIAAGVCLLRWLILDVQIEAALSVVLVLVSIALLPGLRTGASSDLLALGAGVAIVAILHASYRMAFVDGLAGVPNRRALDEALQRISGDYALAMVDIDHFKQFNDRHGHDAGDRVLASVAQQLSGTRGASVFRYGGEEFCLLFTGSRVREAVAGCEEIRERIEQMRVQVRSAKSGQQRASQRKPRVVSGVKVTVSIGLAQRNERMRSADEVLKAADKALYKAKAKGRNRVVSA